MEFYNDREKDLHVVFIDLAKAYNRLPKEVFLRCLEKKDIPFEIIRVIRDTHERAKMRVRTLGRDIENFDVSALSVLFLYCYG